MRIDMTMIESWLKRLSALVDKSALMLILPAFLALYFIDQPSAVTLAQWSLFALVIAGVAVIISRIVFPQIDLAKMLKEACDENNAAAGVVIGALVLFVGLVMLTLVLWAKP